MTIATITATAVPTFVDELDTMIAARKKMTSRLYQVILAGDATLRLLRNFVIHRYPIKSFWTRNILGIASRIESYELRRELVENIFEEETGRLTNTKRHLDSFVDFGVSLGLTRAEITDASPLLPETQAVITHNVGACNREDVHFTVGVASVLLLMEGQPPIISTRGSSMEAVMRDVYRLPAWGYDYFTQHASSVEGSVSEIEDDHASTARCLLARYCDTPDRQEAARTALARAIDLRHRHFDAIIARHYDASELPFRWTEASVG
jgi:pyrroloquinoline-quinone synthase